MTQLGNFVGFIGRLTAEPELREAGENKVVNFSLARNRRTKDKDHPVADFVDFVAWNGTAELIANYFSKGQRMGVVGQITTRTYTDKNEIKRKVTEVLVESVEFIENKRDTEVSDDADGADATPKNTAQPEPDDGDDDANLPF